jgi:hypothetical protein
MASLSSPNPIVELLISLMLIILVIWSIRRSAKKNLVFHPCPICKESIQFSLGLQGGMRGHFKTVHSDYWRWLRKWIAINSIVGFTAMLSIFPLLIYNIIPSRTATAYTGIAIGIWAAVTFSALGAGAVHQYRGRRKFREEWSQKHPLYQRTYGNLRGIEVSVSPVQGRLRSSIGFLIDPITSAALHLTMVLVNRKAGISRLDKYEDGRLWLYNGFDQLVSLDMENPEPRMVDEQRLRISLRKSQLEIRTENSADLNLILSVLSQAPTTPIADPSVKSFTE